MLETIEGFQALLGRINFDNSTTNVRGAEYFEATNQCKMRILRPTILQA